MARRPFHSLGSIQQAMSEGRYQVTNAAARGAARLRFGESDIVECICDLQEGKNFYKSLVDKFSLNQDVYKASHLGHQVYLKVRLNRHDEAVVISFKHDESPDSRYGQ